MATRVPSGTSTLEGLPQQFVSSLRVLFDILDCNKTGYIALSELEASWEDGSVEGLPKGVVSALKKVAPVNGKLSFEQFVAGLKIALLRHRSDSTHSVGEKNKNDLQSNQRAIKKDYQALSTGALQGKVGSLTGSSSGAKQGIQTRTTSLPTLQNPPKDSMQYESNGYPGNTRPNWENLNDHKRKVDALSSNNHKDRKPGDGRSSIASASALDFFG